MFRIALLICIAAATPADMVVTCPRPYCVNTTQEFHTSISRLVASIGPNGAPDNIVMSLLSCGLNGEPLSLLDVVHILGDGTPTVFNTTNLWIMPNQSIQKNSVSPSEITNTLTVVMVYAKYQEIRHILQDEALARVHQNETAFGLQLNATLNVTH